MLPGTAFQAVCSWTWRLPAVRCCVFYKKKTENEPSGEWRYVTIYFSWQHELFLSAACCPPLISLPICDVCFGIWEKYFPSPAVAVPKEVLHLCPSTKPSPGEEGEKMSIPMELMGCSGWGSWRNVINTCTLTAEKILSGAQGDVWARTGSLGKEFSSSFWVGAACHAQPSPQWAAVHSLFAVCTAFLSRMTFIFLPSLHCSTETKSDLGVSECYFHVKQSEKMQVCTMWSCRSDFENQFWK